MADQGGRGGRGGKPGGPNQGGGPGRPKPQGGLRLRRLGGDDFELDHPPCIHEMEPDYEEGMELWRAGEPEEARDALRYALQGCGDNMYVHVALGQIALEASRDPTLARGHFGFAFELAERAIPRGFAGQIPRHLDTNRPLYEAIDGLVACYEALKQPGEAAKLRGQATRWAGGGGAPGRGPAGPPGPGPGRG